MSLFKSVLHPEEPMSSSPIFGFKGRHIPGPECTPPPSHHFKLTLDLDECKALHGHWAPKIVVKKFPKEGNLDIYRYDVGGGLKKDIVYTVMKMHI